MIDEYKLDAFKIKRKSKHSHMNKKSMYIFAI
ncbi:sel1 repeat family protein, partial [Shigella sonnei]|nr:sel1 repeat family protein [Shigella sonnei]